MAKHWVNKAMLQHTPVNAPLTLQFIYRAAAMIACAQSFETREDIVIRISTGSHHLKRSRKEKTISKRKQDRLRKRVTQKELNVYPILTGFTQTPRQVKRGRNTKIPQSGGLPERVGDEAVHEELGDKMERAATIASSLEAE
ncbi:hypothetical protein Tco_1184810 [Tanacetum coccineum]